jgi:hypothetical protein
MSSRRLRADTQTFQTHHQDLISRDGTILSERQLSKSADSSLHHSHHYNNHNSRNIISCPHHVALPDGEWGPDRDLQNRQFCQVNIIFVYVFKDNNEELKVKLKVKILD